jgi:hypothetical protein
MAHIGRGWYGRECVDRQPPRPKARVNVFSTGRFV